MFTELKRLVGIIRSLDKKVIIIFLAVAVLQTISWYYTSRRFFKSYLFESYQFEPDVYLWEYLYWFVTDFITFFILPVLIIKGILKERVKDYGFTLGDYKAGTKISIGFLVIMMPIVWLVSSYETFIDTYPLLADARIDWRVYFLFEAGLVLYVFAWEFIWRGFMLFGLYEKFGYYSVLIQMIPFLILHNGKPAAETFGAIIAGIALGVLALRTSSMMYGFIAHAGVMLTIDFVATLRYRAQDYGQGLNSILNILKHF